MRIWLSQHVRTFGSTVGRLSRAPFASLLNIVVIGIALGLPTALYVTLANLQSAGAGLAAEPQLSVFLVNGATREDIARVAAQLRSQPGVRAVTSVSPDQALAEIKASAGLADIVGTLGRNPLPHAFVVDANAGEPSVLEGLRDAFRKLPGVAHVQLDSAWAHRLAAVIRIGRGAALVLATLLAFALVAITFNTIRLQILTQRQEIEVSKLIGATDPFIRRPFLYYGTVLGLAGGLAAWALVGAGVHALNAGLVDLSRLYGTRLALRQLSLTDSVSLLLFAAWLGWFGAWLSVNRHLREINPR